MTLHARLSHQNLEDYDLIIYDTNNQVVASSKGYASDILEVSHSSWTWNADHKTYLIHVKRQHNGEPVVPHQPWTLDLRGYEADW
jgi:hypothetical protein